MKLSKKLIFIILCLFSTNCFSQEKKLFLANKGGINFSGGSLDEEPPAETGLKIGVCSGWSFGWGIGKHFLILIEGAYDQKGYTKTLFFTDNAGNPVGTGDVKYSFNYFSVPVSVNYRIGNKSSFEGGVGFCSSLLLNARYAYPEGLLVFGNPSVELNVKKDYNKFDPGIFIRGAGNFHVNPFLSIFIEARYTQGISNAAALHKNYVINSVIFAGAGLRVYFGKSKEESDK